MSVGRMTCICKAGLVASNYGLGKIDGRAERMLEIARAMTANGVAASVIARSTGLEPETIAGL